MDQLRQKKGFICDMDGVIYHGNRLLPGVKEFVDWLYREEKNFLFLTNSSERSPKELQQKLRRMGLDVDESHFYTSALATARFISSQAPGCSAYVIGGAGLIMALHDEGITMNDVDPDYVIIGEGNSYNYENILRAVRLVLKGARLIGTNSDLTGPSEDGIIPACRAMIAPIEMARPERLFRGQAQSPDDAHGPADSGGPLRGRRDDRRPHGHRHGGRYRNRPGHGAGALRRHPAGGHRQVPLPPPAGAGRRGRHPRPGRTIKNKQSASGFCRKRIAYCDIFKGVTPV